MPALVLTGLFSVIGILQLYNEPATVRPLTSTISHSWTPLMEIYEEAFAGDNLGFLALQRLWRADLLAGALTG